MLRRISEMKAVTGPGYPSAAATLAARRDWVARFSFPVRSPTHALARPALARAHALARPVLTRAARCTPRPSPHQEKGNPNWNVRKVFSDTDRQYFAAALKLFGELGWPQDDDLLATMFADAAANMKDPATGALRLTDPDTGKPYLFRRAAHTPRSARTPPRAPQSPRPTLRMALAPRAPRAVHSEGFMRDFSREFPDLKKVASSNIDPQRCAKASQKVPINTRAHQHACLQHTALLHRTEHRAEHRAATPSRPADCHTGARRHV